MKTYPLTLNATPRKPERERVGYSDPPRVRGGDTPTLPVAADAVSDAGSGADGALVATEAEAVTLGATLNLLGFGR